MRNFPLAQALVFGAALAACSSDAPELETATASASSPQNPARQVPPPEVVRDAADPNPLGLAARPLAVAKGARVFAVPERMLRDAKPGSSMHLRVATVTGTNGEHLVLDGRDGPDYEIHPGYVIALVPGKRPRLNQPVIAEWAQSLRHGVVRRYVKDKVVVRFTDTQDRGERQLSFSQTMAQVDGFRPGNYAAVRTAAGELEHVLLVSPVGGDEKTAPAWFVLGFLGAAHVVKTDSLVGVPISLSPKVGAPVLAEHLGKMRAGVVKEVDAPGLMKVKFERAGRPVDTAWGFVMPPLAPQ